MASLELKGDDILMRALQTAANMKAHKEIVKKRGSDLQKKAIRNAVFKGSYSTGATRQDISLEIIDDGYTAVVKAGTEYSGYVEKGTRKMNAQPFMKPAHDEVQPKFIEDLRKAAIIE
ncbi:HK97-gp10 family putative phage morphogenesis protein [Streptococcus suis]|uniref:HK97-gp10 family putative phage morphogenesis protein n=1 Tax=Streptococcus suis TaxID=1307 RepID=UPI00241062AE|nr:HK97-gp10 family putative phage morphogenesis protein [Streptococcus suis]MDG3136707.1 HK97 gp10 family phage protein [Streptococcus suis]